MADESHDSEGQAPSESAVPTDSAQELDASSAETEVLLPVSTTVVERVFEPATVTSPKAAPVPAPAPATVTFVPDPEPVKSQHQLAAEQGFWGTRVSQP